jgi:hypothetical protein
VIWCVYYDDGRRFTNLDGEPWEAPGCGVMGIRQLPPGKRQLITRDFYLYRTDYGCWIEVDRDGLVDHFITAARHITACLAGRTVPDPVWKAAMKLMAEDGNR